MYGVSFSNLELFRIIVIRNDFNFNYYILLASYANNLNLYLLKYIYIY